jgi:hypothetical protein
MEEGVSPRITTKIGIPQQVVLPSKGAVERFVVPKSLITPEQPSCVFVKRKDTLVADDCSSQPHRRPLIPLHPDKSGSWLQMSILAPESQPNQEHDLRKLRYKNPNSKQLMTSSTQYTFHLPMSLIQSSSAMKFCSEPRVRISHQILSSEEISINPLPVHRQTMQKFNQRLRLTDVDCFFNKKKTSVSAIDVTFGDDHRAISNDRVQAQFSNYGNIDFSRHNMQEHHNSTGTKVQFNKSINLKAPKQQFDRSFGGSTVDVEEAGQTTKYNLPNSLMRIKKQNKVLSSQRIKFFRRSRDRSLDQCLGDLDDVYLEAESKKMARARRDVSHIFDKRPNNGRKSIPSLDVQNKRLSLKSGTSNDTDGLFLVKNYNRYDSQRRLDNSQKSHNAIFPQYPQIKPRESKKVAGETSRFSSKEPQYHHLIPIPPSQRSVIGGAPLSNRSLIDNTQLSHDGDMGPVPNFNVDRGVSFLHLPSPKLSGVNSSPVDSGIISAGQMRNMIPDIQHASQERLQLDTNLDLDAIIKTCSVLQRNLMQG